MPRVLDTPVVVEDATSKTSKPKSETWQVEVARAIRAWHNQK